MQPLSLRPLSVGEILDAAIKLVSRNFKTMFTIAALVLVPVALVQYFLSVALIGNVDLTAQPPVSDDPQVALDFLVSTMGPVLGFALLTGIVGGLAQVLVQLGSVKAVADVYLGFEPQWRTSLAHGLKGLPKAIVVFLIAVVPVGVGFVLCILPGLWLLASWSLVGPVIALENSGPARSLGRSFQLVKKRFWPVLGVLALLFVITSILQGTLGGVAGAASLSGELPSLELQAVISLISNLIVIPFSSAVLAVLYFDLRVRQEGFDLQLMAMAVGEPAPEALPPASDDPFGLDRPTDQ